MELTVTMDLLEAVAICIYWDWEVHAPENLNPEPVSVQGEKVPLAAFIRKYEVRENRAAS